MSRAVRGGVLLALPLLLVLLWWLWPAAGPANHSGDQLAAAALPAPGNPAAQRWSEIGHGNEFDSGLENLPGSLTGTEVPDGLKVDANGNLVVSLELRDLFDYFLSTLGEEDIDTIVARMRAYIDDQLPGAAAAQAHAILNDYLAFRESLTDLPQAGGQINDQLDISAVRQQQAEIRARRQQYLPPEVEQAFYQHEDTWSDFGIARLEILQDDSLDPQTRAQRLDALRQSLPMTIQSDLDAILRYQDLQSLSAELAARGGSEADLRLLREQVVGPEAADRLESLEQERAQFQSRVDQWLVRRAALLADENLAISDRQQQVEQQRARYFTEQEQVRVTTLERLHDQKQGSE